MLQGSPGFTPGFTRVTFGAMKPLTSAAPAMKITPSVYASNPERTRAATVRGAR